MNQIHEITAAGYGARGDDTTDDRVIWVEVEDAALGAFQELVRRLGGRYCQVAENATLTDADYSWPGDDARLKSVLRFFNRRPIMAGENKDRQLLEKLAAILDGREYDVGMLDVIAGHLRDAGFKVRELGQVGNEGTLISGTHRPQDLIPALAKELYALQLANGLEHDAGEIESTLATYGDLPDDSPLWQEDFVPELIATLMDELSAFAPVDHYFGAHPGDGSDFGYWMNGDE